MRNPYSGEPFTTSDADIAAALEDVSVPALLLSCVHMNGDASLLDGPLRPTGIFLNEVQGFMSEQDQAAARTLAFDVIRDYRDRGCPEPGPVDAHRLKRMMDWLVCTDVPGEYVPMMLEEMELDGRDSRVTAFESSADSRAEFPVVVVGCGQSGLLAAIRMQEAGIPYTVIEKNAGVGGTWWENTYPGARVDVGNHFYCYSFEPTDHWSEYFARQPELQAYFEGVMHRHGIADHVRFSTEVLGAEWNAAAATKQARRQARNQRKQRKHWPPVRRHSKDPRSTPPDGITTSTSPERMLCCWAPARAASRSRPPSPTRYAASPSFSGPRSGCSPIRITTPKIGR